MSDQYLFPEVYVRGVRGKKCLCNRNSEYTILPCTDDLGFCSEVYGHIPYEQVLNYIDLVNAKILASIAILRGRPQKAVYEGFLLAKGTEVCLQEVSGNYIYFPIKEGASIEREFTIAYTITGKLEVRKIKSLCEGLVVLIIDMPWEEPRKAIVVVVDVYRSIIARKST